MASNFFKKRNDKHKNQNSAMVGNKKGMERNIDAMTSGMFWFLDVWWVHKHYLFYCMFSCILYNFLCSSMLHIFFSMYLVKHFL